MPLFYCTVKFPYRGVLLSFLYESDLVVSIGDLVLVPLKTNEIWGIVIHITLKKSLFKTRKIINIFFVPEIYKKFIIKLAKYLCLNYVLLYKKIINQLTFLPKSEDLLKNENESNQDFLDVNLSKEQQEIFDQIIKNENKQYFLLHGVTGSGKTYVYIALIQFYLKKSKSVLCLFPHINLAETIGKEIKKYFPRKICFFYHAQTAKKDRELLWKSIVENKPIVIFGVHLPLFAPLKNVGFIIVDEEHDQGYAQTKNPYINSKEAALIRASSEGITILLGSATPSAQSFFCAKNNIYFYIQLKMRFYRTNLPKIFPIILEKDEKKNGISKFLVKEIEETINRQERVILFLNKKGIYSYAICLSCKYIFLCKQCNIMLTIFSHYIGKCGRCSYKKIIPQECVKCGTKNEIKTVGCGIQKVSKYIKKILPSARILEIDGDQFKKKIYALGVVEKIESGEFDIVIGTHLITKGYNFDKVSLVGILNADQTLSIPHFMTVEEMIRQCIQAAGRAGRKNTKGKVVLQSHQDISSFLEYVSEENYLNFLEFELEFRKKFMLSPYIKMVSIFIKSLSDDLAYKTSLKIYEQIKKKFENGKENEYFFEGPKKYFYSKVKNMYYYQIEIKSKSFSSISDTVSSIINMYRLKDVYVFYVPNPIASFYE